MGLIDEMMKKKQKKVMPQHGGANPRNIDAMVAAGEMSFEEGEAIKKRIAEQQKTQKVEKKK
jgi:hypothetical protein